MGLSLSDEQKRRIENEEQTRLVEEEYRAKIRHDLTTKPPEPTQSNKGRIILGVLFVLFVIYLINH